MKQKRGLAAPGESYYRDEPGFRFAFSIGLRKRVSSSLLRFVARAPRLQASRLR